ncbi:MAG: DUF2085 domain-containing protein [Anaerolineales bacterium]|nr:DUF2085 domain-containing protein [Anaerolineales bacterium]MCZ2123061.1 DUF2085 domain-containing protein [Anaerolineales bacterium]
MQNAQLIKRNTPAFLRDWFFWFMLGYGLFVFLPFLAPALMHAGWTGAGKALYFVYSFFCHQLPERSYFLFGEQTMYSLSQIQNAWQDTNNPMILRQFIGNSAMGWKVAWSDRMISFYTSVWFFALLYALTRKKIKPLSLIWFCVWLIPMAVDGGTHMISDLSGIGSGFRDSNAWLAALTHNAFTPAFYAGDALGSFNAWMRFITGILAGVAIAWCLLPRIWEVQALEQELPELNIDQVFEKQKS